MIKHAEQGTRIELGPNEVVIRLAGEDTGGSFSLLEYTAPPDGPSPPPHIHEETDEAIHVLEGKLECRVGDDSFDAEAGSTVFVPQGTVHDFTPAGSGPARFQLVYSPAGFEGYFEEMGAFLESLSGPPDQEQVQQKARELSKVYDQTLPDSG